MDLHLSQLDPRDTVRLFINDRLCAEITVGLCEDRDHLLAEVTAARCLQTLARWLRRFPSLVNTLEKRHDHACPKPEQRQAAFLRGLCDGMAGRTVPHSTHPLIPGLPPEHSTSYGLGYSEGQGWRRALAGIAVTEL